MSVQYLFTMQYKCKRLTSIVFGMVHCDRIVVVLLHKHFSSWLSTSYNYISIITSCTCTNMGNSNITAYVNNFFIFFKLVYYSLTSLNSTDCLSAIFHFHCTSCVYLHFSLIFIPKAIADKGGLTQAMSLYHQLISPYIWLMVWQWYHCCWPPT